MNGILSITSTGESEEFLQSITLALCNDLNREIDGVEAKLAEERPKPGTKGDVVTIGTIVLTLIGSGGVVVSLVNVLKAYIDRGSHVKLKIKGKNGEEIELDGANLSIEQIKQTTDTIKKILGASK